MDKNKEKSVRGRIDEPIIDADRLIVLVEARTAIYDYTLKEHHNQDIINKIWSEIANELNVPGM